MEMAVPPDGANFNQYAHENATRSCARASTRGKSTCRCRSQSHDRKISARGESICPMPAPDVSQFAAITSHYRRDLEDLLWARTEAVATPNIDFDSFANLSLDQWEPRGHSRSHQEGFHTYLRRLTPANIPSAIEVLVTGQLECSLAEAAALLRCPGEVEFNGAMNNMYGRSFQRGSVVHSFTSAKVGAPDAFPESCGFLARHRCVKTACFARPRLDLFGGDERWCLLEEFAPLNRGPAASQNGFTLSQRSLQPATLPPAVRPPIGLVRRSRGMGFKRSNKRTHQLAGLSVGYLVEAISGSHPAAVRIVFYGCCSDEESGDFSVIQRRMKKLARGVLKLPAIVRRRRMSAQVPADAWSISRLASKYPSAPTSSRCVSCSRKLHSILMVKKTRCYLCAHFVCSHCWIRQPLDTANGRKISVLVCPHCLRSVQNCNYAHLAASALSDRGSDSSASTSSPMSMAGGVGGEVSFHTTEVLPDADDAPEPGHAVIAYLEDVFSDQDQVESSPESFEPESTTDLSSKTQTAVNVLQQLMSVLDEGVNRVLAHSSLDTPSNFPDLEFDVSSALQKLQVQFEREVLPLEACVLSNAVTRTYPIDTSGGGGVAVVPVGPLPPNERSRLAATVHEQLLLARGSDELLLICELATRELNCMASLVTIIGRTLQYVLATDFAPLQDAELPRQHTICQHLLMGDRPMIVRHPEADVRFCNLSLVVDFGIQFYAGFPIFSSDGLSVVGSLCCLDVRSRELAQSQYSTLLHLIRTVSHFLAVKCRQQRTLQPLQKQKKRG